MRDEAWPILGTEARAAGRVTKRTLRSQYQMLHRNVYVPRGQQLTPVTRAVGAWLWSGRAATVAGRSAAALHRTRWIDARLPAELIRPQAADVDGIVIHRETLLEDDVCTVWGIPTTTAARTAFDLGRREPLVQAIVGIDALANASGLHAADLEPLLRRGRGARGLVQLRQVMKWMDGGAESPPETRTRLLLCAAGFPRPRTQIVVCNENGYFIGRLDMGWPEWKVGVEYDGPQHWTDPAVRARDIDRAADLAREGWTVIRVSRDILRYRPEVFLTRVRDAMRSAGWPDYRRIRIDATLSDLTTGRVLG